MVPPTELQIDIFVTNAKPMMRVLSSHGPPEDPLLAPPNPQFARNNTGPASREKGNHSPSNSVTSVETDSEADSDVDLSYYESEVANEEHGELGHDEHILDLTNFEDDDDTAMPGEALLNVAVREEGKKRRSVFRKSMLFPSAGTKFEADHHPQVQLQQQRPQSQRMSWYAAGPGTRASVRLVDDGPSTPAMKSLAVPAIGEASSSQVRLLSPMSAATIATPTSAAPLLGDREHANQHFTFPPAPQPADRRISFAAPSWDASPRPSSTYSRWSGSEAHSLAALVSEAAAEEQIRLDLDEEEIHDISVVAERARAGRPVFSRILADEVERAKGAIIVGCE